MNYENKPTKFTWEGLGDIDAGRGTLGPDMPVFVYRLFQFTLKDILDREYDEETSNNLYRAAGHLAGTELAKNILDLSGDFDFFVANLTNKLKELKIGILRIEKADLDAFSFTLTVSEDLDCSGLPLYGETVCDYDEGFIAGILETYSGQPFTVREVDCWATGARTCRFSAELK
ncbi:V4R domain-containing protein [Lachnoclostridium phytofermentans]|uniref:4-vinyl reductase 4VR n=1 Tax=Lachnoclostridium phytofermentans (strain ATCC 700394 / DSM 18823 / ISDg) TaxID=357809 RepID=A9KQR4_LACP7|nr:V4R domain-containing protein [Lachnoclostridium phytofermentans]ABX41977.1 4-vinyl reductase 4VR [Lachnoclostridium phytofermentans ISDg]